MYTIDLVASLMYTIDLVGPTVQIVSPYIVRPLLFSQFF